MNIEEILTLVQAVSDSSLTSFKLEQGDTVISLRKEKEEAKIVTVGAPAAPAVFAASAPAHRSSGSRDSGRFRRTGSGRCARRTDSSSCRGEGCRNGHWF